MYHDFASGEVVGRADYFELAGFDAWRNDGFELRETFDSTTDVGSDGVLELVAGKAFALDDGGLDAVDEIVDGSGERVFVVNVLDSCFDRSALAVAEDHDEVDAEFGDGVLDASLYRGSRAVDVVAGDADGEDVSNTDVEEYLGGDARVGATDDCGDGILPGGERLEVCGRAAWVSNRSCGETLVAFEKEIENVAGRPVRSDRRRRQAGMLRLWLRWR